jgi:hypothetical protein
MIVIKILGFLKEIIFFTNFFINKNYFIKFKKICKLSQVNP